MQSIINKISKTLPHEGNTDLYIGWSSYNYVYSSLLDPYMTVDCALKIRPLSNEGKLKEDMRDNFITPVKNKLYWKLKHDREEI